MSEADKFMAWYADNFIFLRKCAGKDTEADPDIMGDAALAVYDAIARGRNINDYKGYFLRVYRNKYLDSFKHSEAFRALRMSEEHIPDEEATERRRGKDERTETVMNRVTARYGEKAAVIFELYTGLYPVSKYRFCSVFGLNYAKIRPLLIEITGFVRGLF